MKIPVAWLREHVAVPEEPAALQAFADRLTMAGLEVEEIISTPAGPTLYTKITPNRGDWASVYGTAREAAAANDTPLKPLPDAGDTTPDAARAFASVRVVDGEACPRYAAKIVRNVFVAPSPSWMQDRLLASGMRPVNNVVDVTNYVMLELGQPLHAFDLDTLPEGIIVVRQADGGERLVTLDGVERALEPGTLCICDRDKPVAIAGILGGGPTEVSPSTKNLLLESAHFDPLSVRRTAKRLGIATEASYRFERHVDPALVSVAAERAASLLHELAGGEVVPGLIDVYERRVPPRRILARVDRIRKLLGVDIDRDAMIAGLARLGLSVERSSGALDVVVPSFRPDLAIEDDIAEEVGRIALGYENLPETLPPPRASRGRDSERGLWTARVRETLVRAGLQEVLSHSLTAPQSLVTDDEAKRRVHVRSALSPELSSLRTSLVPNLLEIATRAHTSGLRDIALFEVGPVYHSDPAREEEPYEEPLRVAGVLAGSAVGQGWSVKPEALPLDLFYAKGVVEGLLQALGLEKAVFAPAAHPITHPGRTAFVSIQGDAIGMVAELSEIVVAAHDLPRRTYVFDLDGDALRRFAGDARAHYVPLPRFPAVTRDVAPVLDRAVPYAEVATVATGAAGVLLESLRLTDVYEDVSLGLDKRSLTLRLTFRSPERTLKDAEVEAALALVRTALTSTLGADLRGG